MDDTSRVGDITAGSSVTSSDRGDGSRRVTKDGLGRGGRLAGLTRSFGRGTNVDRRNSVAKASVAMSGEAKT